MYWPEARSQNAGQQTHCEAAGWYSLRAPNKSARELIVLAASMILMVAIAGCDRGSTNDDRVSNPPRLPALTALGPQVTSAVVALGKLEPAGGVLPILVPAGDRIAKLNVAEGDSVSRDQIIAVLESLTARETELSVAETQLREARERAAAERDVAEAKLEVAKIQLEKAELELEQAEQRFRRAKKSGGALDLLDQQVKLAEAKLIQFRAASTDPSAGELVSQTTLNQQELVVSKARAESESARADASQSIERGRLSVESARRELEAAQKAIASGEASTAFASLEQQIELLRLQVEMVKIRSPIDGVILSLDATTSQATTGAPLMHVADLSQMICRAEVDVSEIRQFEIGAQVKISSPALDQPLTGKVESISRMIGSPQLPSPYPMGRVDWRSAEVIIAIDPEGNEAASRFIHLQVDVAIEAAERVDPNAVQAELDPSASEGKASIEPSETKPLASDND